MTSGVVDEHVKEGIHLETLGRGLALNVNEEIGWVDKHWMSNMENWHYRSAKLLEDIMFTRFAKPDDLQYTERLKWLTHDIYGESLWRTKDALRKELLKDIYSGNYMKLIDYLTSYDNMQTMITGRSGMQFWGKIPINGYTYSMFISDYTSCFHQYLLWWRRIDESIVPVSDKVWCTPTHNPSLKSAALLWEKAAKKLRNEILYFQYDYEALRSLVKMTEVDFRLDTSPEHTAHIEEKLTDLVCECYELNEEVKQVFARLCEHWGMTVTEIIPHGKISVIIPKSKTEEFFVAILPFVTSMDMRLDNPPLWWTGGMWRDVFMRLPRPMMATDIEFRMCKIAGEDLLALIL